MSAIDKNAQNLNLLSPLGFKFQIRKLPDVNYFLQRVTLPQITLPEVSQPTPFTVNHHPGDHIDYGYLDIVFKVDEDLNNYRQIHSWVRGLGFPTEFQEYQDLVNRTEFVGAGIKSDATLIITTDLKNPNIDVNFQDCFPTSLGALEMNTTDSTVQYITCGARFAYTLFDVELLP